MRTFWVLKTGGTYSYHCFIRVYTSEWGDIWFQPSFSWGSATILFVCVGVCPWDVRVTQVRSLGGFVQFASKYYKLLFWIQTFWRQVKFFKLHERSLKWIFAVVFELWVSSVCSYFETSLQVCQFSNLERLRMGNLSVGMSVWFVSFRETKQINICFFLNFNCFAAPAVYGVTHAP